MMGRSFTTREKVLLVVLALLLIGIGYYKLLLEPINDSISQYQLDTQAEQDEILSKTVLLNRMKQMQKELEEIYAEGEAKPLPAYDNADNMLVELNTILSRATDYTLNFSSTSRLEGTSYVMQRPLQLKFTASSYALARGILNSLHDSDNINQISDLSIKFNDDYTVEVTLNLSYFELIS